MTKRYWNITFEEMMEAGVHFGHEPRKWNPRMAPFISGKRKGIHITNLTKTARFLSEACDLAFDAASTGKQFLIVETRLREFRDLRMEQKIGKLNSLPKRDATMLKRQLSHLERYLGDLTDISIQANDDVIASIGLILKKLVFAICEGHSSYIQKN
ncbi:unnamed protein product [Vicia faba]|uniref:Small ribosomal subunit protein uS2c n=1 Tax=Vicia faba TaxID=3906 RepID=A0AAV0ZYX4_VICFA|nr:unnamed protein product [Vicia faba]